MSRTAKAFTWARPHWEGAVAIVLVVVAVVVFVRLALFVDRPLVDDALISIGYARSLADGDGLRPTAHSQISEGFSNPTWTFVLAIFEKLHINSMGPAKWLGMLLVAASLPIVSLWGPVSQQRRIQLEDSLAPLLASSNATVVYWSLGGLETGILVFLVALFGLLLFAKRTNRIAVLLGLAGAALVLTRPEAALYAGVLVVPWLLEWAIRTRLRTQRSDWVALAALVVPVALYIGMRKLYFGSWLPNTYYAKASWFINLPIEALKANGVIYVETFVKAIRPIVIASAAGVGLSMMGGLRTAKSAYGSALVAGAMFYFGWYARADWMKEWRFLAPSVLFVAYPVSAGVSGLRRGLSRAFLRRRRILRGGLYVLVAGAAVTSLVFATKVQHARWAEVKALGGDTPRQPSERDEYGKTVYEMVAPFKMAHPFVAGPDMGYLMLGLRDAEILDLAGLTDVPIARHYGNLPAVRDYLVNEGLPTVLFVWGPSNYLWSMPDVLGDYRSTTTNTYKVYAKASATTDERCPDGKPAALADASARMVEKIAADLDANKAIRALALWRCYVTYRKDAELPSEAERANIALAARARAEAALQEHNGERALRAYSLCAVISPTFTPSSACRMRAELIRGKLFPRPAKK